LNNDKEISISELAVLTNINKSTVQRICSTLVKRGYIYQVHNRGDYSAGIKFLQFQHVGGLITKMKDIAHPFLKKLSDETSESSHMGIWDQTGVTIISNIFSDKILQGMSIVGNKPRLHSSSLGKLFLAYMTEPAAKGLFPDDRFKAYTEHTISDYSQLKKELVRIRQEGVSFDDEESELGLRAVAAPVKNANGKVIAAIGILGPSVRMSRSKLGKISVTVKDYAEKISKALSC
jgi:DNA-binding IclR family transcriptional regulator